MLIGHPSSNLSMRWLESKLLVGTPSKIPSERLYEMDKKLYLISISVEGLGRW
jgi:hypothetical protein